MPILIGTFRFLHASTTAFTFSWLPMLPGLILILSIPWLTASIASRWSKWMSATSGIEVLSLIFDIARASSIFEIVILTMSAPILASSLICLTVDSISRVLVFVIDWIAIGWLPPIVTVPILISFLKFIKHLLKKL